MKEKQTRVARRNFLAGAGVVAAAAGTAALTSHTPALAPLANSTPDAAPADSKGYRISEHVRKYYRTTLV
ncbi:twin-arginine translocation signal domain-containing protein [Paracidovorax citrulli]